MSSYDDPRWYEQQPEQNNSRIPSSQQPPASEFGPSSPYQIPGDDQKKYTFRPLPSSERGRRPWRSFGRSVLLIALLLIAFVGGWLANQAYSHSFSLSNQSQSYLSLIEQAWTTIDQHYVDRKAVDYKQMSYQAIEAMLKVLNDKGHTRFLTPEDVQSENQQLSGTFTGIGIYLRQDPKTNQLLITATIPGSPAEKAGFKHGDIILAVNGTSTKGKDVSGVSALIQGNAGTSVALTVLRPSTSQTLIIKVVREEIKVPNVIMHYIAQDHVADIQVAQFASGVSDQLKNAITQAKRMGANKIILDLRENPGGYLSEAVDTASEFIKSGNVLLEQDSTGNRTPYAVSGNTVDTTDPMVVLVNGDTASAAEIVSGALQDNHRAIILGDKTFGTGTVLEEFSLSDGSAILLGTQEWLTPDGHFIRDIGICPNIQVHLNPNISPLTPTDENAANMSEQQILTSGDIQLADAVLYLDKHVVHNNENTCKSPTP